MGPMSLTLGYIKERKHRQPQGRAHARGPESRPPGGRKAETEGQ